MKPGRYLAAQKINRQKKNVKNVMKKNVKSLEVIDVVLVQCNLVDNQYQNRLRYYELLCSINLIAIS